MIKEKLLKDSFIREAEFSMDVTKVVVDTRSATHDILKVWIRLTPVGQLVTDKTDSVTLARRLIPDSLRLDKEPSTLVADFEKMMEEYFKLLIEARMAVSTHSVNKLAAFLKETNAFYVDLPAGFYDRLAHRVAGDKAVSPQLDQSQPVPNSD